MTFENCTILSVDEIPKKNQKGPLEEIAEDSIIRNSLILVDKYFCYWVVKIKKGKGMFRRGNHRQG